MDDTAARQLSLGDQGDDVAGLHAELALLGFPVPVEETRAALFGAGTAEAVARLVGDDGWQPEAAGVAVDRRLVDAALQRAGKAAVFGTVTDPSGTPAPDIAVRLVARRLSGEEETLGNAVTDVAGRYTIRYLPGDGRSAAADRLVRVDGRAVTEVALPCPAPRLARVDLQLSGWEALHTVELAVLRAELDRTLGGADPAALTEPQLGTLACAAGVPLEQIQAHAAASRLRKLVDAPLEFGYGLAREGVALDPAGLLRYGRDGLVTVVQGAAARNVIPEVPAGDVERMVDWVLPRLAEVVLAGRAGATPETALGPVLTQAGIDPALQTGLLIRFSAYHGAPEEFWRELADDPHPIDPDILTELRHTLQLAALTGNSAGLVHRLRQQGPLRDLAAMDRPGFAALVREATGGELPPGLPGDGPSEQLDAYVDGMRAVLRAAFPSVAIAADIAPGPELDVSLLGLVLMQSRGYDPRTSAPETANLAGVHDRDEALAQLAALRAELTAYPSLPADPQAAAANPVRAGVAAFLREQEFEFGRTMVADYLAANPDALSAVAGPDRPAVADQLHRLERVGRFVPDAAAAHALLGAGLSSAQQIGRVPPEQFAATFGGSFGGPQQALSAHTAARAVTAATTSLFTAIQQGLNGVSPAAIGGVSKVEGAYTARVPGWQTLFRDTGFCSCDQCRSVLSPAAYLVDLLHFLTPPSGPRPVDELLRRRPDIQFIKLSCPNTNVVLPYVDLVNEVLETYIAVDGSTATPDALGKATAKDIPPDVTADDLAVSPAYLDDTAYETLRTAHHPLALPYNRPADTVRTFLPQLGTARLELLRAFPGATPATVTAEALGLAPEMAAHIAGTSGATLEQCWGAAPGALPAALQPVPAMLAAAGVSYPELIELVETGFVNPDRLITLDTPAGKDPCDLGNVTLRNLDAAALDRLHRFLRLARATGTGIPLLDARLTALGATTLDESVLTALADAERLRAQLTLDPEPALALLGGIPTVATVAGGRSLYARLFTSPAVVNPPDPAFALNAAGTELAAPGAPITAHLAPLLAGLRINAGGYATLSAALLADGTLPAATLTLANLGTLYRHTTLARALGVSLDDLLALRTLTGLKPFGSLAGTAAFVAAVQQVRASSFTVPELDDLLRAAGPPEAAAAGAALAEATLRRLRDGLRPILAATLPGVEPTAEATRNALGLLLDAQPAGQIADTLDGTVEYRAVVAGATPLPAGLPAGVQLDLSTRTLTTTGALTAADRGALTGLAGDPDWTAAVQSLYDQPRALFTANLGAALTAADIAALLDAPSSPAAAFASLLARALPYVRDTLSRAIARQCAVDTYGLPAPTAAALLDQVLHSVATPARPLADDLLAVAGTGLDASYFASPTLAGPAVSRVDATVDFAWGTQPPDPALPAGAFSVRWTGKILPPAAGQYTFTIAAPDGVRLTVDGLKVIDNWVDQPQRERSGTVPLPAGRACDLVLEHYHQAGAPASVQLRWSAASTPPATVPAEYLFRADPLDALDAALTRLGKAASVVTGFGLGAAEVLYLGGHGADFDGFDLNAYPLRRDNPAAIDAASPALFAAWRRIADYAALRTDVDSDSDALVGVFAAGSDTLAQARLAALAGWDATELTALSTLSGLTAADWADERAPRRVAAAMGVASRTGVPVARLADWAATPPDPAQALDVIKSAKAQLDDETWAAAAKPLQDGLRDRRRAALVAYLLATLGLDSADQLFEHFLLDVEITAAVPTARIRQAMASVQLFVQRCLLNMDPAVPPILIDAEQWTWRSDYRLWQANREVMLFAENWLDSGLRDDKTPLFAELESQLMQDELTADNVEQAFRTYLDGLEELTRLDICALVPQTETDGGTDARLLHVFGRTFAEPYVYYHRTLAGGSVWSPWRRIPVEVTGRHLMPVVWNRQLQLIWPVYTGKSNGVHVDMAWTVYRHGTWSRRHTSPADQSLLLVPGDGDMEKALPAAEGMTWSASFSGGDLVLECRDDHGATQLYGLYGGINRLAVKYDGHGFFRFPSGAGTVTSTSGAETIWFDDGDYVVASLDGPPGLVMSTLGDLSAGGAVDTQILDRGLSEPHLITLHPWVKGAMLAPGEVSMYGDQRHTYYVRSRWTGKLEEVLRNPYQAYFPAGFTTLHSYGLITELNAELVPAPGAAPAAGEAPAATLAQPQQVMSGTVSLFKPAGSFEAGIDAGILLPHGHTTPPAFGFSTHYHPYVGRFIQSLNAYGVPGLLTLANQQLRDAAPGNDNGTVFKATYSPTVRVDRPYPREDVDFSLGGPYSTYNWELFFHAPLMIAITLSANQRFDEAERWFRYIFNPTSTSADPAPARYWNVGPFHDALPAERLADLLAALDYTGTDPGKLADKASVQAQLQVMAQDPFNPHHIARLRLTAYQMATVMAYIDHVLARGDQQFNRGAVDVATQSYLIAAALLGPRPQIVPEQPTTSLSFRELLDGGGLDDFSNALVTLENAFPFTIDGTIPAGPGAAGALGSTFYFCIPPNGKLLGYWDTVADRLFKIRHGLDIEGIARQLPLYGTRIDPAVLIRAVAAGADLNSVLSDLAAPAPYSRFTATIERAKRLCQDLCTLGSALLTALEKKDAEELAALRTTHEIALLDATSRIKKEQIAEATAQRAALDQTQAMVQRRHDFFAAALAAGYNSGEQDQLHNMDLANSRQEDAAAIEAFAQGANLIPNVSVGSSADGPTASVSFGGQQIAAVLSAVSRSYQYLGASYTYKGSRAAIVAEHTRRAEDWQRELDISGSELAQIAAQAAAADARITIAGWEAENSETQREQAADVLDFLRNKYTNEELYRWLVSQTSTVYFQTYKLVYDVARQAERAYRYERAISDSGFIQFGYWDSMRHGLLAGEQLRLALAQLEEAYHRQHRRELELSKSVSLLLTDPLALINLKATGACQISLPEELFDADYPGHYLRRVKSVSVSVPCVVGPYTTVNATLRLLASRIRTNPTAAGGYPQSDADPRFSYSYGSVDAIATSSGQRDSGMFELNFRDERYLPFEGAGAISTWRLEMPPDCNAFDFETITDVVLHLNYTARDAGVPLRDAARGASVTPVRDGRRRMFSARQEYPDDWYRFLHPEPTAGGQRLTLGLDTDRFPYQLRGRAIQVTGARVFLKLADGTVYPAGAQRLTLGVTGPGAAAPVRQPMTAVPTVSAVLPFGIFDLSASPGKPGDWLIEAPEADIAKLPVALRTPVTVAGITHQRLNADLVHDLVVVLEYTA